MEDSKQRNSYYSKDLQQRKNWYSPVAIAYDRVRPRYPKDLIHRVVEVAQLSTEAKILELGCGPGTATVAFAQLGFSIICLEPSDACQLARQNCLQYPNVEIKNTTFEEWNLEAKKFDAVLAATSIHWISPEMRYAKAAEALQDNGALILLWNTQLQPQYEVYQVLDEVYQRHAPSLTPYESRETQAENLRSFGQSIVKSGRFDNLVSEQLVCEVTYSVDDYLALLSTYSPYIELDPQSKNALFKGLREKLQNRESIDLSYLSIFQVARKQK